MKQWLNDLPFVAKAILSILVCFAFGAIGGLATSSSVDTWYQTINKPSFNPPNWIFGPVWSLLYLLMGIAFALVWHSTRGLQFKSKAYTFFAIQLILNSLWSIAFFGMQSPLFGIVVIATLLIFIILCIKSFLKINKTAAYLMVPYLLWVSFASILNVSIFILN